MDAIENEFCKAAMKIANDYIAKQNTNREEHYRHLFVNRMLEQLQKASKDSGFLDLEKAAENAINLKHTEALNLYIADTVYEEGQLHSTAGNLSDPAHVGPAEDLRLKVSNFENLVSQAYANYERNKTAIRGFAKIINYIKEVFGAGLAGKFTDQMKAAAQQVLPSQKGCAAGRSS